MNGEDNTLLFLKSIDLFSGLSAEEIRSILPLIEKHEIKEGEWIFKEGDEGKDLYIVVSGEVQILKTENGNTHPIAVLGRRSWFGEMAYLGEKKRLASVKATQKTELWSVDFAVLIERALKERSFSNLAHNLLKKISDRLNQMSQTAAKASQKEVHYLKVHDQMSRLIVHLFFLIAFYFMLLKLFYTYAPDSKYAAIIPTLLILLFAFSAWVIMKKSGYSPEFYGLTLKNWKKNAWEGFIFTIPILLVMVLVKWVMIHTVHDFKDLSLFKAGVTQKGFLSYFLPSFHKPDKHEMLFMLVYVALVPAQEFISRGCLQASLQQFFTSSHRVFLAIVMSNLMFSVMHGFRGIAFIFLVFILGLFWGWLFARQKSIIGTSVSHALVGVWGLGILHYQEILTF